MWAPMLLRERVVKIWGSLGNVMPIFQRLFVSTFHELLIATTDEVNMVLQQMCSRPKSQAKEHTGDAARALERVRG